jgi:hypothetical protein
VIRNRQSFRIFSRYFNGKNNSKHLTLTPDHRQLGQVSRGCGGGRQALEQAVRAGAAVHRVGAAPALPAGAHIFTEIAFGFEVFKSIYKRHQIRRL